MYVPHHFALDNTQTTELLHSIEVADLVTPTTEGLVATFLPVRFDGQAFVGHLARANPHWKADASGESLLIARGPDAYISPRWYASKAEHGRVVPTWNYTQVHVHGTLEIHDDPAFLRDVVTRLTDYFEMTVPGQPWQVDDAPEEFIAGQLRAIVGVRLVVTRVEAKAKLSQNRSDDDRHGVIAGLGPQSAVAADMQALTD